MAWDSTCSECTYIDTLSENKGLYPCTNKRSGYKVVSARKPKCNCFCAIGVGKRTTKECRDLERNSKENGYFIVSAITEILNLIDKTALTAFEYIKDVYMPTKDEYASFLTEYEDKGATVADSLRNDEKAYEVAAYFYDNYLIEFSALVELGDYDAASILYLEMYDKMLEHYGMKSTRIKPTTLKLVNPDCKGQF